MPFVVGLVVFVWQALRAPFRQRDDARKEARRLYRELHPEFPPHAVEVGMLVHGEVPDQYDASRRKRVLFLRIDYTNRGNRNVSLDFEMQWHRSFLGEHGVSLRVAHYALPTVSDILAVPLQLQPDTHARGTLTFDGEFVLGAEFDESGEVVVKEGWRADLVVTDRITGATNRTAI
jgi:hypothetical protein